MKVLLSSSRGKGSGRGRGGHPGRGRGDTHSSREEKDHPSTPRENRSKNEFGDARFSARFTDPRFKVSQQLVSRNSRFPQNNRHQGGKFASPEKGSNRKSSATSSRGNTRNSRHREGVWEELEKTKRDPRFAKHFQASKSEEEEEEEEEEAEEQDEENPSLDDQEMVEEEEGEERGEEEEEEDVCEWGDDMEYIEPQRRLAVVQCDWDHVRAVDLYALLFHGLPLGGELLEVCVYKSEFGKRMMEHERIHGPDLWVQPGETDAANAESGENHPSSTSTSSSNNEGKTVKSKKTFMQSLPPVGDEEEADNFGDDDDEEEEEDYDDGQMEDDPSMLQSGEEGENGELFSSGKYRQYEFNRMKYYYAVATFDSPETAAAVYHELDGMDIEASGVILDLRYIDDSEVFQQVDLVSRADSIPANFKPLRGIRNPALSQTKFRISWDQEDPSRYHSVQDSFCGTSPEDDLAAYLASPLSDSDEENMEEEADEESEDEGQEGSDSKKVKKNKKSAEEKILSKREKKKRVKQAIRRRYAALLEEIGVDPDNEKEDDEKKLRKKDKKRGMSDSEEDEEGEESLHDSEDHSASSLSSDDDDDLNHFSDIEDEEGEEDEEGMGMEATLDLNADDKATALQKQTKMKRQLAAGNLSNKAEVKYKLRRKEAKKLKKETARQEREREKENREQNEAAEKKKLKSLLGEEDGTPRVPGKERRKAHAKEVKHRIAEQREERKRVRAANLLGVSGPALAAVPSPISSPSSSSLGQGKQDDAPGEDIDARFQHKLLSDPRYHLDVAQRDKRVSSDITALAAKVASVKKRSRPGISSAAGTKNEGGMKGGSVVSSSFPPTTVGEDRAGEDREAMSSMVDYFLHEAPKKKKRQE